MTEFKTFEDISYAIPDDLTLAQFILDSQHPARPTRPHGKPWLIEDATGREVGFEEVRERVFGLANGMSIKWNIREGDVVCVFSPNHIDYPIAIWATHRLGAVVTAANPSYNAEELEYQVKTAKANTIFAHPGFLDAALDAAKRCGIPYDRVILFHKLPSTPSQKTGPTVDDLITLGLSNPANFVERRLSPGEAKTKLAFLSFSSGTTGKPKAVAISHYSPIANIISMSQHHKVNSDPRPLEQQRFRPGDVAVAVLPFFHIYGLVVNLHWQLFSAISLVVIPKFDFVSFLNSIVRYRITHLFVVPPQVVMLCKSPVTKKYDISHVRFLLSGAAPLTGELMKELIKIFPNADIGQGYGMTETCTTVAMFPPSQKIGVHGSAGQLVPGCRARVVKPDGTLAKVGEIGELVITGPCMALGYANNAEATKETFVDGWVRTGDEVYFDPQGELFIVDRLKEIMKVRGFQVAPAELEGHLLTSADVDDCCVVGVPDDYSGELPMAFVVLSHAAATRASSSPAEANAIKAAIAKHVADHKVKYKHLAGGIEIVDVIPKNPSGKLLRRVLRETAKEIRAAQLRKAKL
ncbi:amp dependent CoA ligase [Amylostereum chailletii]|nr:amp dependent CoA ligase [Amylostereum chailletii]